MRISVSRGILLSHGCVASVYWKLNIGSSCQVMSTNVGVLCDLRKVAFPNLWNIWDTENVDLATLDLLHGHAALQVVDGRQVRGGASADVIGRAAGRVEPAVVVPGDDHFHGVWL